MSLRTPSAVLILLALYTVRVVALWTPSEGQARVTRIESRCVVSCYHHRSEAIRVSVNQNFLNQFSFCALNIEEDYLISAQYKTI